MKINKRVTIFLGNVLVEVIVVFLLDYPLVLSLLKHRGAGAFLNQKIKTPNRRNLLNNSTSLITHASCA